MPLDLPPPRTVRDQKNESAERPAVVPPLTLAEFTRELHGTQPAPILLDNDTDAALTEKLDQMTRDGKYDSFEEFLHARQAASQRDVVQFNHAMEDRTVAPTIDVDEYSLAHEELAYYHYVELLLYAVEHSVTLYKKERAGLVDVPADLADGERQMEAHLAALTAALQERRNYAGLRLSDQKIREASGDPNQLRDNIRLYLSGGGLSNESIAAFNKPPPVPTEHAEALNQRIIDILAGNATIPGVKQGFSPGRLYFSLLAHKYAICVNNQARTVRDGGKVSSSEDTPEGRERKRLTTALVAGTDTFGKVGIALGNLSTLQTVTTHFNTSEAGPPRGEKTPPDVREALAASMEKRSEFHLGMMQGFVQEIETTTLSEGLLLKADDFWTKHGRNGVKLLSEKAASIVTAPLPQMGGVRQYFYDKLTDPISDAMGWPKGKEKWEDLTPEEKEHVKKKSQSMLDGIRSFDRTTIENFYNTASFLRALPPINTLPAGTSGLPDTLPSMEIRTQKDFQEARATHGDLIVYGILGQQLIRDWGSPKDGSGFMGQYGKLYGSLNEVIDTKFEVGSGIIQVGNEWADLQAALFYAAVVAVLGSALVTSLQVLRKGYGLVKGRRNSATLSRSSEAATIKGNKAPPPSRKTPAEGAKAPAPAKATKKLEVKNPNAHAAGETISGTGKMAALRHTAMGALEKTLFALGAAELIQDLGVVLTAQQLQRTNALHAAEEFLTQHPAVNRDPGSGYEKDLASVRARIRYNNYGIVARALLAQLKGVKPAASLQETNQRALVTQLAQSIATASDAAYLDEKELFPIEDALFSSSKFFDPAGRIVISPDKLDEVRRIGRAAEEKRQMADALSGKKKSLGDDNLIPVPGAQHRFETAPIAKVIEGLQPHNLEAAINRLIAERKKLITLQQSEQK